MKPTTQVELSSAKVQRETALLEVEPLVQALCNAEKSVEAKRQIRRIISNMGLTAAAGEGTKLRLLLTNKGFHFSKTP